MNQYTAAPLLVPAFLVLFVAAAWLASWLIENGIARRSAWRLAPGLALAAYLLLVWVDLVRACP